MKKSKVKTINPNTISQAELHHHLLSAVAPRPICFASTIDKKGNVNLSPFSFFNVFSSNPPVMVFSPARRGKDNTTKHTYENILEVKETVINIVNYPMVEKMSLSSTEYDKGVNEFIKAGLTQIPSEKVKPPRVGEAPVSFECEVDQVIELGENGGAGNLIITRVILIHMKEKYLDKKGYLETKKLDLVARMGGSWYTRANQDSLFEIPKPGLKKGIGIDALPKEIRDSKILSANNLGRLGNVDKFPSEDKINEIIAKYDLHTESSALKFHQKAKEILNNGTAEHALSVLLYMLKTLK
ncbi:MAG: flavin reductase [Flammeovirgaceae bacterium]|nr:flavin reductase [Flammeovirgaceae bacterium]|tara:strand:- start:1281 stop:2174 length:894 start_codon:yes stop_codon:yes gene_type:complete